MDGNIFEQKNIKSCLPSEVMEAMKISVIIPVYNCREFLDDCLKSVTNQTYHNLEIILVDDGSTDGSDLLCDGWKATDDRVRVFHQENQGVSAARNRGLELATGDVLSFIDADDTLDQDMYEFLIDLMIKYNADISHCGYKHIVGEEVRLVHDTKKIYKQDSKEALRCLVGGRLFVGSLCNKLYRATLVSGLRLQGDIKINEDILYNFEAFSLANTIVFADYAKYNYIAHKMSSACFVTPDMKKANDSCKVNQIIYARLKSTDLADIAAERYLRSLSCYYRECVTVGALQTEQKRIAEEMWHIYSGSHKNAIGRNMRITALLTHYAPQVYRLIYFIYDRIRKPNWEV